MNQNKNIERKLKEAERLKEKRGGFLGMGAKSDFVGSAMIYEEIAETMIEPEDKEKYYIEAAETFEKDKSEYSLWRASECYRELFEIFLKENREKAAEFQIMGLKHLKTLKKYNIAGQRYVVLGELFEIDQTERALQFFKEAAFCYSQVPSYKANLKVVKQKILICLIVTKNTNEIVEMLRVENNLIEKQQLCLQLCLILKDDYKAVIDNDLKDKNEQKLIETILNGTKEEIDAEILRFKDDNYLNVYESLIFEMFEESYSLENELC